MPLSTWVTQRIMNLYLPLTNIVYCWAPLTCLQTVKQFVWSAPEGFILRLSPVTFKKWLCSQVTYFTPDFLLTSGLTGCSLCRVWCPPLQGCCSHCLPWSDVLHIHQDGTIRVCCTCWTLKCFVLFKFLEILFTPLDRKATRLLWSSLRFQSKTWHSTSCSSWR